MPQSPLAPPAHSAASRPRLATLHALVGRRPVRFVYPEAKGLEPFVRSVLDGTDYPLVFPGLFEAKTIVDIGAHAGGAVVYLKAHYPAAQVFAFEPSAATYACLRENVGQLPGVATCRAALSDADGELELFAGEYSSMQNSLKPNAENGEAAERVRVLRADRALEATGLEQISILKVDTEGCELEILASLKPYLPRTEVIYLEYHSEADRLALDVMLSAHDFVLHTARADESHRGTNTYVRRCVLEDLQAREGERYVFEKA